MRRLVPLIAFTGLYVIAATAGALGSGNREFVFYLVVMAVLITVVMLVHARVRFSLGVLWLLSIWGLVHMAGGLVPAPSTWTTDGGQAVLYSWELWPGVLKYDQVVHAYGFGVTTWACWQALHASIRTASDPAPDPTVGRLVLCAAAGMGFGAFNEVVEFVATLTIPETNVGGYRNTGFDLVANLVGAAVAAVIIRLGSKHGRRI